MQANKSIRSTDRIALALLLLLAGVLLIGDFRVVLANSSADDSPVLFGRFLADPGRFDTDLLHTYAYIYAFGTAVHWVPALLYRVTHFPLEISAYVITLLQTVLLGFALYSLAFTVTQDRLKTWITVCFGLGAEVYSWNLANYATQMHSPYAGHFVLPLLLFGLNAWLQNRTTRCALWLSLAAVVHPTLTLLALGLLGGHTALRGPGEKGWRAVSWLVVPLLLAVLPPLFVQARFGGDLASSIVADLMRVNMHMNPFRLERWYKTLLPTVVAFLAIVGLGAWRSSAPSSYRTLVLDAWVYSALLGVVHFLAVRWHVALIMTVVPLRFVSLAIVLSLPLAVAYLSDTLEKGSLVQRWASGLLLLLPALGGMAAMPGAVAACALAEADTSPAGARTWRRLAALVFGVWLVLILAGFWLHALSPGTFALLLPGGRMGAGTFTAAVALAGLLAVLAALPANERSVSAGAVAAALLAALLLVNNARKGERTLTGEMHDLYLAQSWARQSTDARAVFLVEPNIAWRVGSDRAVIEALAPPLQVYSHSAEAQKTMEARMAVLRQRPWVDENAVLDFATQFGGQYIVRYAERPPVFQQVYRNSTYAIYKLPQQKAR